MNQSELRTAILETIDELSNYNQMVTDYWISEMYDENDEEIPSFFTQQTFDEVSQDLFHYQEQ